jgi:dolichol-phosphate mannosyltransferase
MIVVVLPAYNEASCLGDLLNDFHEEFEEERKQFHIILVNDGSTDRTEAVAQGFKGTIDLEVITHQKNKGLAEAIKTGLMRAAETCSERDVIITMDADNSHLPGLIFRMARMIREGNDVVIASRYQKGAKIKGLSFYRKLLSFVGALLFRITFPMQGVRDFTCGYRAYRASLLKRAFKEYGEEFISEPGFSCMVDILLKIRKYEPIVSEVPIILRYDQKISASKMNVGETIMQTLQLMLKRRLGI